LKKNPGSYSRHQLWNAKRFEIFYARGFEPTVLNLLAWKPDKYQTTTNFGALSNKTYQTQK